MVEILLIIGLIGVVLFIKASLAKPKTDKPKKSRSGGFYSSSSSKGKSSNGNSCGVSCGVGCGSHHSDAGDSGCSSGCGGGCGGD